MMIIGASTPLGSSLLGALAEYQTTADRQTLAVELETIRAEAMGWLPLGKGAYLHQGNPANTSDADVIQVVGIPDIQMAAMDVLLLI